MSLDIALLVHHAGAPVFLSPLEVLPRARAVSILAERDSGPQPISIPFEWEPLDGTDGLEVGPTTLTIGPPGPSSTISLGELVHRVDDGRIFVEVPDGHRIVELHLDGLRDTVDDDALEGQSDLGSWRLAVTPIDPSGRFFAPAVTVPAVDGSGERATMFGGGSFVNGTLTLPELAATTIRIALVKGDAPDFAQSRPLAVDTVTGWAGPHPRDLTVRGPDGAVLWSFPGTLLGGTPPVPADLTVGLQGALDARHQAGEQLAGEITITAAAPSKVGLGVPTVRGSLLRSIPGTTKVRLAGNPTEVPVEGPQLPSELPTTVVADVHVAYDGVRLADISDLLPEGRAGSGVVVGGDPVVRALAPAALRGEEIARVGLVGRAPVPCEMTIHVVDASPGVEHQPLADPVVTSVDAAAATEEFGVVWAEFDPPVPVDRPVAISATVTSGRFWWVADPEPLVRLAIVDPDPGGRPILLAGQTLLTLEAPTLSVSRAVLPGAGFAGGTTAGQPLELASALFCSIELTDLTLRYARPKDAS
jgi:hypothetical protein